MGEQETVIADGAVEIGAGRDLDGLRTAGIAKGGRFAPTCIRVVAVDGPYQNC